MIPQDLSRVAPRTMKTSEWISLTDRLREQDALLARGFWHGYTSGKGAWLPSTRGEYFLVRWRRPTVAVSHDDPEVVIRLARAIEAQIFAEEPDGEQG